MIIKVSRQKGLSIKTVMLWRNKHAIHGIVRFSMRKNKGKLDYVNLAYNFASGYEKKGYYKGGHYNAIYFWGNPGYAEVEFHSENEFEKKVIKGYMLELENIKGEFDFIMMPQIDAKSPYCEWKNKGVK